MNLFSPAFFPSVLRFYAGNLQTAEKGADFPFFGCPTQWSVSEPEEPLIMDKSLWYRGLPLNYEFFAVCDGMAPGDPQKVVLPFAGASNQAKVGIPEQWR